ncbi:MAG: C-terminal target protein [Bacteroidetes bacterium]|jgi:spore coat protein CotH|nr:C-terminal target protein [Bacteroidota bacterium]
MKKFLLLTLLGLNTLTSFSQSFYDMNTIQTIEISFSQTNWDYLLDTATQGSETYLMAQWVKINGVQFDSAGVKYKGNSTYNASQVKNPFHIALDEFIEQDYQGYTDIKLSNAAKDPSFAREVLSYNILRQYMHAPLSNYAKVYVNGAYIGLYVSSESVSKKFVNNHFYSKNNAFFKCNPPAGAGPGTSGTPNLVYLGTDSTLYYARYEMNSDHGWKELIALCDTLSTNMNNIEKILDVDKALWMIAFDNTLVNLDSYIGGFTQNYYLYRDHNGRFNPVVWDLNESFGTFSSTGTSMLSSTTAKQQMTPTLHISDANWPLVQKLLAVPMYKRMYIAHMRTILAENFGNGSYLTTAQSLQTLIGTAVNTDVNKFFTYSQFTSNLTTDVASGMTNAPGLSNLMNGRNTWLNTQALFTATYPTISSISTSSANPALNSNVTITADVTNSNSNGVYLGYRYSLYDPFQRILMYDDGAHNDGAASDGTFGVDLPVNASYIHYYIYSENNNAGMFSPQRAEYEYYTLLATIPTISAGQVVINEILATNTTISDQSGQNDDWIELYNNSSNYISLKDAYLSDSQTSPLKWQFPDNATIAPNSYLIIWADKDTTQSGLHANFKLSGTGEKLIFSYANGTIVDSVTFGTQPSDISYQRCPNGTGPFATGAPTYNAFNCVVGITENENSGSIRLFPNPANNIIQLESENEFDNIRIYNVIGHIVYSSLNNKGRTKQIDISSIPDGIYFLHTDQSKGIKLIIQH